MGIGRAWPSDTAEITRSVSRQRFGAAACRTGVSLALAKARGSGKLGPAFVHLEGDRPKIRDAANRAQGSSGERALLGAACRGDAPQGALRISGCSPFHPNIDEDHFKRSRWSAGTGLTGEASIWFRAPVSLCETASQELTGLLHAGFMKFLSRYARTPSQMTARPKTPNALAGRSGAAHFTIAASASRASACRLVLCQVTAEHREPCASRGHARF